MERCNICIIHASIFSSYKRGIFMEKQQVSKAILYILYNRENCKISYNESIFHFVFTTSLLPLQQHYQDLEHRTIYSSIQDGKKEKHQSS